MRVRDGFEHAEKQLDARTQGEPLTLAVRIERLAFDVFQHEVRLLCLQDARIQQTRDIGMVQPRENAPLLLEALFGGAADPRRMDEFDRDDAFIATIGAMCAPDAPHPAAPQFGIDHVRADLLADERRAGECLGRERGSAFEKAAEAVLRSCGERGGDLRRHGGVGRGKFREPAGPIRFRQLERGVEQLQEVAPLGVVQVRHRVVARLFQIR